MKLLPILVATSLAENKSVKFVTGVTSVSSEFPSDIIDLSRNMLTPTAAMFGLWISEEIVSNIKSTESYRPYEHYLIDSLQNVDPRVIDLKLYQGNWKQINAQSMNYIGWLPVGT